MNPSAVYLPMVKRAQWVIRRRLTREDPLTTQRVVTDKSCGHYSTIETPVTCLLWLTCDFQDLRIIDQIQNVAYVRMLQVI